MNRHHQFLPIAKAHTKVQLDGKGQYAAPISDFQYSTELKEKLGFGKLVVLSNMTQVQMYEVMSITSDGNAALLLHSGYRDRMRALKYLKEHGLTHLIVDSSDLVAQAMDRRIPAFGYLTRGDIRKQDSLHMLDALEIATSATLSQNTKLVNAVLNGTVRLEVIKKGGYVKLSKVSQRTALKALTALSSGNTPLTAEGFSRGLDSTRYGSSIASDGIELGLIYGDRGIDTRSPYVGLQMHEYLTQHHPERSEEYRIGAVQFAGNLHASMLLRPKQKQKLPKESVLALYETGASVEDVLNGTMRVEQALAIRDGLPASVSSGLL